MFNTPSQFLPPFAWRPIGPATGPSCMSTPLSRCSAPYDQVSIISCINENSSLPLLVLLSSSSECSMLPPHSCQKERQKPSRLFKDVRIRSPSQNLRREPLPKRTPRGASCKQSPWKLRRGIEPVLPTQDSPIHPTPVVRLTFSSNVSPLTNTLALA